MNKLFCYVYWYTRFCLDFRWPLAASSWQFFAQFWRSWLRLCCKCDQNILLQMWFRPYSKFDRLDFSTNLRKRDKNLSFLLSKYEIIYLNIYTVLPPKNIILYNIFLNWPELIETHCFDFFLFRLRSEDFSKLSRNFTSWRFIFNCLEVYNFINTSKTFYIFVERNSWFLNHFLPLNLCTRGCDSQ